MDEKALVDTTLRRNIKKSSYTVLQQHYNVPKRRAKDPCLFWIQPPRLLEYIIDTLYSYIGYIYLSHILFLRIIFRHYIASLPK